MKVTSLKARFSVTILLVYLLIGLATYLAFDQVTGRVAASLGSSFASKQALLEKSKMLSAIRHDLSLSQKMASSPILKSWLADEQNPALRQTAMTELESFRQSLGGGSLFFAIDRSGHYYYLDGAGDGLEPRPRYTLNRENINDAWYFRTIQDVDSYELNVDYDNHLNVYNVWFNVIIRDAAGHKVGMCGSGIDITAFVDEVISSSEQGIETILFSHDGAITGHDDKQYMLHNSAVRGDEKMITVFDLLGPGEDSQPLERAIDLLNQPGQEVTTFPLAMKGTTYLAALSYLPEIKWFNLVLVDPAHFVSHRQFLPVLVVIILATLVVILVISFLLNRLVLVPLQGLTSASAKLARGNFEAPEDSDRSDEIGTLTRSFGEMARMIKDHTENLEQKVNVRTAALDSSNRQLAEANLRVMDSIRYAQMIQASILPDEAGVRKYCREFFALYRPRDIVGGDIYSFRAAQNGCVIALIDCTGHGVPGAFMTMTASAVLNHVLDTVNVCDPATVLGEFNRQMKTALHHDKIDIGIDNGLEIGLCWCQPAERKLIFAGAKLPLYLASPDGLSKIPGDRQSIGYRRSSDDFAFTGHALQVAPGTTCYLASDGILDQAGGPHGWGFGNRRFAELLKASCHLSAAEQRAAIEQGLATYQGETPQRDDITVIGFKF